MDIEQQKMFRDYAWNYFSQHAEQRLKAFNFYIVFCAVVISGYATIVSRGELATEHIIMPISLIFLSFVFWKLDQRTVMLIENGQAALKYLDSIALQLEPESAEILALFKCDEDKTKKLKTYPFLFGYFSYKRVFKWVFAAMCLAGILGCIACIWAPKSSLQVDYSDKEVTSMLDASSAEYSNPSLSVSAIGTYLK